MVTSLQERRNLLDFLHVVHIPQGSCESGAAVITNTVVVQAGNIPRKKDIKPLLLSIPSRARAELQSHTDLSLFRDGISQSPSTSSGMAALLSFMYSRLRDEITKVQLTPQGQLCEHSAQRGAEQR